MKKGLLFILLFTLSLSVRAQETETEYSWEYDSEDITTSSEENSDDDCVREKGDGFAKNMVRYMSAMSSSDSGDPTRWKRGGAHWTGFGIHYNGLVKNIGTMKLPAGYSDMKLAVGSIGVDINLFDVVIVSRNHFGFFTGIGLEFNNFRFDNNISLIRNTEGIVVIDNFFNEQGIALKKSKLTTGYVNVPLMVEFKFGGRDSYQRAGFVNFGVLGGIRIVSRTKIKSSDERMHGIFKQRNGLNLRDFHYGFGVNVGYRLIALSAKYYPHSIFMPDGGPNVQQVNLGISLLF